MRSLLPLPGWLADLPHEPLVTSWVKQAPPKLISVQYSMRRVVA